MKEGVNNVWSNCKLILGYGYSLCLFNWLMIKRKDNRIVFGILPPDYNRKLMINITENTGRKPCLLAFNGTRFLIFRISKLSKGYISCNTSSKYFVQCLASKHRLQININAARMRVTYRHVGMGTDGTCYGGRSGWRHSNPCTACATHASTQQTPLRNEVSP